jgi:hypothetical protein
VPKRQETYPGKPFHNQSGEQTVAETASRQRHPENTRIPRNAHDAVGQTFMKPS